MSGIRVLVVRVLVEALLPTVLLVHSVLPFLLFADIFAVAHSAVVSENEDKNTLNGEQNACNREEHIPSCGEGLEERRQREHLHYEERKFQKA